MGKVEFRFLQNYVFCVIMRNGGLKRQAAEKLGIKKPVVTEHMNRLEYALGMRLFKNNKPTDRAWLYFQRIEPFFIGLEQTLNKIPEIPKVETSAKTTETLVLPIGVRLRE